MARIQSGVLEQEALRMIATLMASSVRTAPKAHGIDDLQTLVLDGEDLETLAAAMEEQGKEHSGPLPAAFLRDANNVRKSGCLVLIGCKGMPKGFPVTSDRPLDCGACGYKSCEQLDKARLRRGTDFAGPVCAIQSIDLGIAIGSAVKMATELNADNRIMYTIGATAMRLKLMDSDIILGIPISLSGKSPFFDRKA
jgi:uncharacterized ferredoxin-like protein